MIVREKICIRWDTLHGSVRYTLGMVQQPPSSVSFSGFENSLYYSIVFINQSGYSLRIMLLICMIENSLKVLNGLR